MFKKFFIWNCIFVFVLSLFSCSLDSESGARKLMLMAEEYFENYLSYNNQDKKTFIELTSNLYETVIAAEKTKTFKIAAEKNYAFNETFKRIKIQSSIIIKNKENLESVVNVIDDLTSDTKNLLLYQDYFTSVLNTVSPSYIPYIIVILLISILIFVTAAEIIHIKLEREKNYSRKILQIQEEERIRLSNELHDTIAQDLKTIQMRSEMQNDEEINLLAQKSIKQIRTICYNLMPPEFILTDSESRLEFLLEFLCKFITEKGLPCSFFADENLPDIKNKDILLNIFRITQEALNNALKHSKATQGSVIVRKKEKSIVIFITDNGCGIPRNFLNSAKDNHFGIKSMKSRASLIKAKFEINSLEDDGTEIRLEVKI